MTEPSRSEPHGSERGSWREWMIAAQAGDADAYERLLRSLWPELERFARGRLRDSAAVEDVVQTVLLSLHRARHTYRPERAFEPWIFAIARNAVVDAQRKQSVRRRRELPLAAAPEPGSDPSPTLPQHDGLSPELAGALSRIPAAHREAVELLKLEGLSVAEAAARVGISAGALKVRAHRGYKALRRILGDDPL